MVAKIYGTTKTIFKIVNIIDFWSLFLVVTVAIIVLGMVYTIMENLLPYIHLKNYFCCTK